MTLSAHSARIPQLVSPHFSLVWTAHTERPPVRIPVHSLLSIIWSFHSGWHFHLFLWQTDCASPIQPPPLVSYSQSRNISHRSTLLLRTDLFHSSSCSCSEHLDSYSTGSSQIIILLLLKSSLMIKSFHHSCRPRQRWSLVRSSWYIVLITPSSYAKTLWKIWPNVKIYSCFE